MNFGCDGLKFELIKKGFLFYILFSAIQFSSILFLCLNNLNSIVVCYRWLLFARNPNFVDIHQCL